MEVRVRGALVGVLRLSALLGAAPLRFRREGGTRARASPALALYGALLVTALFVGTFLIAWSNVSGGGLLDESRGGGKATFLMWLLEKVVSYAIAGVGVYGSYGRIKGILDYLNRVDEVISRGQDTKNLDRRERKRMAFAWTIMLLQLAGLIGDYLNHARDAYRSNTLMHYTVSWAVTCGAYVIVLNLKLQVTCLMYAAHNALAALNDELRRPLAATDAAAAPAAGRSFGAVCAAVRALNRATGALVLLSLASVTIYIVVSVYFLFQGLCYSKGVSTYEVVAKAFWVLFHNVLLIALVEPGYQTQQEVGESRLVLSKLMYARGAAGARCPAALAALQRQLALARPAHAPLRACTLDRSLYTSIMNVVTTGVVIIIQYRMSEQACTAD